MIQLSPGHIFEGRYQIQRELGRGGFGMVYLAYQVSMDRLVALKVLSPNMDDHTARTAHERFLREVKIISKLRHPNTVTIHDYGESGQGMVYMVLEYVEGETLKEVLTREGKLSPARSAHIGWQIAKSLVEAHQLGIVHRDLKPANIMLTAMGSEADFVKVLDFGVARLKDAQAADLTSAGLAPGERELIGTPRYMSPEQVRGHELTGASDAYSLGLVLYEMVTGEPAVQGDSTMALITQQVSPEPLRLPHLRHMPLTLQGIIQTATSKEIHQRYVSIEELAHDLDEALLELRPRVTHSGLRAISAPSAPLRSYDMMQLGAQASGAMASRSFDAMGALAPPAHPSAHAFDELLLGDEPSRAQPVLEQSTVPHMLSYHEQMAAQHAAPRAPELGSSMMQDQRPSHDPSLSSLAPDLPPPPSDFEPSAFADEDIALDRSAGRPRTAGTGAVQRERDQGSGPLVNLILLAIVTALLIASTYLAFIVIGAALEVILGGQIRLVVALIATFLVPGLPLLAEGGRRERFKVPYQGLVRLRRAFGMGVASSLMSFFLISLATPAEVIQELRAHPNWFLSQRAVEAEQPHEQLNRELSYKLADLLEDSAVKSGRLEGRVDDPREAAAAPTVAPAADKTKPTEAQPAPADPSVLNPALRPPVPTRPPASTRSGPAPTRPSNPRAKPAGTKTNTKTKAPKEKPAPLKPADKDYVSW